MFNLRPKMYPINGRIFIKLIELNNYKFDKGYGILKLENEYNQNKFNTKVIDGSNPNFNS